MASTNRGWFSSVLARYRSGWSSIRLLCCSMLVAVASSAGGQVVINEVVYDIAGTGVEVREFIELYNAGNSTVNIGDWMLKSTELATGLEYFTDIIPAGTMLAAGDYWVLGSAANVANVDQDLGTVAEPGLWPDGNTVIELKDSGGTLIDALAYEVNKGGANLTVDQIAQTGSTGWWGNTQSYNILPDQISLGRYLDGRDTNNNGRDFGITPLTPGATNGLAQNANYSIPDVDALTPLDPVPGFLGSFVNARVIDPTVADASVNETAITASPQGGKAIIAWDDSGGGNMVFSNELVTKFDMWAYINTTPYGEGGAESTTYGIGTTGSLHNLPDPTGLFFGDVVTANGNTGVGWVIQKEDSAAINKVMLIDFNNGGPSNPGSADWTVLETIEMGGEASDWYRLAIDYDPTTGNLTAIFDDQTYNHTIATDLLGTFYVGYRESLAASPPKLRPPTFDLFVETTTQPGDHNGDGFVNAADYVFWRDFLGDAQGYQDWRNNFGATPGSGAGAAVPEPGSLCLALLVGVALSFALRGRRQLFPLNS